MDAIHYLSKKYGFKVIEDASHALGAIRDNLPIGADKEVSQAYLAFTL